MLNCQQNPELLKQLGCRGLTTELSASTGCPVHGRRSRRLFRIGTGCDTKMDVIPGRLEAIYVWRLGESGKES